MLLLLMRAQEQKMKKKDRSNRGVFYDRFSGYEKNNRVSNHMLLTAIAASNNTNLWIINPRLFSNNRLLWLETFFFYQSF